MWKIPSLSELVSSVVNPSNPIGMRMRAAYYLRSIFRQEEEKEENSKESDNEKQKQDKIVVALAQGLHDERQGSLMRHEFAYVMGQLRDDRCCPALEEALRRNDDCVMVRHEAAEALGAIGASRSVQVLNEVMNSNIPVELSETCQISLDVMTWRENGGNAAEMPAACACMLNPYSSLDPAPPHPSHANMTMPELGKILGDSSSPLFQRYRAMFSLRNFGGEDAVQELCRVLVEDDSSALLRHEVAYVLGQMQHPSCVEALEQSLRRTREHTMVRHESAEALGAIDGRWDVVEPILNEFIKDEDDVVRESCMVALDAADYWRHEDSNENNDDENVVAVPANAESSFARAKAKSKPILQNHFNLVA